MANKDKGAGQGKTKKKAQKSLKEKRVAKKMKHEQGRSFSVTQSVTPE